MVRQLAALAKGTPSGLGGLELKGIPEPVEAFELRWEPLLSTGIALPERLRELPAAGYVGRAAERERLSRAVGRGPRGSLRLALISGEAGVGKTRLSTQLALQVHGEGATVLYGRCDEDLGVPYQPWAQALGHLVETLPKRSSMPTSSATAATSRAWFRPWAIACPTCSPPRQSDPETERYLLYAAVAGLLERRVSRSRCC